MSNISETVRDTRNVSMNHDYETEVALSDFVNNTCVKRSLAEKSRWCHIRLAIKPRYLGNHASQIKRYYGMLSGSRGRSFRISHEKSPETLPSGEVTMTSYPPCNKTSLSRKPCIPDKNYYRTLAGSHGRSFRIRHKNRLRRPLAEKSWWRHIRLAMKPCYLGNYASQIKSLRNAISKSWSLFQNPSWKIDWSAPGGEITMAWYLICNKSS